MMNIRIHVMWICFVTILFGASFEFSHQDTTLSKPTQSTKPGKTPSYNIRFQRARELAISRQYRQAIEVYNRLLYEYPDNPDVLIARGRVFAWEQRYEEAEVDFLTVTKLYPDYGDAWSALGHLYFWWNKPTLAVDAFSTCIILIPDNPEFFISRSKAHLLANHTELAKNDLEKAGNLGGNSDVIELLNAELTDRITNKYKEKIIQLMEEADSIFTQSLYDSALTLYLQIIELDSTHYTAHFKCAQCYSRIGNYEEAVKIYTKLISSDSTDADARLERGRIFTWMGNYNKAELDLVYVTSHFPQYGDALSALAKLYLWQGLPDTAIAVYSHWLQSDPQNPEPFLGRAEVYYQTRLYPLARKDLLTAGKLGTEKDIIDIKLRSLDRITSSTQWEARSKYDFQYVGSGRANWHQFSSGIKRELSWGSIFMDLFRANRFEKWDEALILETYYDIWTRTYLNLRLQTAFKADILPGTVMNLEIFQGFGNGWEVSGSYRYMDFPGNGVHSWGISFAKYLGDWYGNEKTIFFSGKKSQGYTQSFLFRRYLGVVDDFLEVRIGFGKTIALVGLGPKIETRTVNFYTLSYQTFLNSSWGLSSTAAYNMEGQLPIRLGVFIGLIRRW